MANKYNPYPGDIIPARLEPGEFVLNRNAVKAIGKEKLKQVNDEQYPRFATGGEVALRRPARQTNRELEYVGNMSRGAYDNAITANRTPASGNRIHTTDEGYNQWLSGNYSQKSPMAIEHQAKMNAKISGPTEIRKPENQTYIDLHAIKEIPTNPEFNIDEWNGMIGPMSQNLREYSDASEAYNREQVRANKKWYQRGLPLSQQEIDNGNRIKNNIQQMEQKDAYLNQAMAMRADSEKRNNQQKAIKERHSSVKFADEMREADYNSKMQEYGEGPKAPINPNTGQRFMTVDEGDRWDAASKKQLSGVRDKALQDAQAKQKRAMAIQELKRGMHQSKMESKIDGPNDIRRATLNPEKVKQPKVPQRGKSSWLSRIKTAASASKHDSHKGARLRKAEPAPLTKKEEILKKADKKFTGPENWEATEKEILDYKAPKVVGKKAPMTKAEVDEYWDKSGGNEPVDWGEDRTVPEPKKAQKPGQYPQERIDKHKEGDKIYNEAWDENEEMYNNAPDGWVPSNGPPKKTSKIIKVEHPGTGPLIDSALRNSPDYVAPKAKPVKKKKGDTSLAPKYSKVWNPKSESWDETMAKNTYDKTWDAENKKWKTEWKQEGGLIRQYAIGDYVEEGKEVFDAGVDATKAGFGAVAKGAGAVADRYGRNDYADARADGSGKVDSALYGGFEALQQAGSDTLTAGATGLGAISKLAKGTKNMAVDGYGGAKDWLGAGGWNQNAAVAGEDTLDDDGNVIEKGRSAAERVWSGDAKGSLKQRMSKGAGLLGGLLQDASVAQGFEGAPEGYYDKFGFGQGASKKAVNPAVSPEVNADMTDEEWEAWNEEDTETPDTNIEKYGPPEQTEVAPSPLTTLQSQTDPAIGGGYDDAVQPDGTIAQGTDASIFGPQNSGVNNALTSDQITPALDEDTGDPDEDARNAVLNQQRTNVQYRTSQGHVQRSQRGGFISMDGFIRQSWRNL